MRVMVYGDSNSWGFPPDGSGLRFDETIRWPAVMADELGAVLIEEALPGRTTAHDDPEMLGAAMNGLRHLPVALLSHCPLDLVLIMLGTNDFKARFAPSAEKIAANIARLLDCVQSVGGGAGPWDASKPPQVAVVVPPPLSMTVETSAFERHAEWHGGRAASLGLADAISEIAAGRDIAVFDAGRVVAGSADDPIHLDADSHIVLGRALAHWLQKMHAKATIPNI